MTESDTTGSAAMRLWYQRGQLLLVWLLSLTYHFTHTHTRPEITKITALKMNIKGFKVKPAPALTVDCFPSVAGCWVNVPVRQTCREILSAHAQPDRDIEFTLPLPTVAPIASSLSICLHLIRDSTSPVSSFLFIFNHKTHLIRSAVDQGLWQHYSVTSLLSLVPLWLKPVDEA